MARQRVKINFWIFNDYLSKIQNSYYDSFKYNIEVAGKQVCGVMYKLSKPLEASQKQELLEWMNVEVFSIEPQSETVGAVEAVFIADKIIK